MNIKLRNLEETDIEHFYSWINAKEVIKYSLSAFQNMRNINEVAFWYDGLLSDESSYTQIIINDDNKNVIGYAGIAKIDKVNFSGEYFILIGDKSYHNKGIGAHVTKEIIKIGFEELNLNRIMLTVFEKNIGAFKAYCNAGFKIEGTLRQVSYRNNEFHNKIIMSILKQEYFTNA